MVSVKHTGPEVGLPAEAPAGSLVSALDKGYPCGIEQFRCVRIDLVGRIEAVEVGNVPVLVFGVIHVLDPFLELTILSYLHRREFGHCLGEGLLICLVNSKFGGRALCGGHDVYDYLVVHGTSRCERVGFTNSTVLGTY